MSLPSRFKGKERDSAREPGHPAALAVEAGPGVLVAPAGGRVIAMDEVPDPVFAGGMLGEGCGVWPDGDVVYAPLDGTVTAAMSHAVGIAGDDGAGALVHVGVDTVEMGGDGFELFVAAGTHVRAGQPLVRIDRGKIAAAGHPDCVVLAVSNAGELGGVSLGVTPGMVVRAGEALLRTGGAA